MQEKFKDIYVGQGHPYLRPYICNGNPYKAKICFVGTNPATPIYPEQINKEEYIKLYNDYAAFMKFYKENRVKNGKTAISRTRMGIISFAEWAERELGTYMIETDIFTYPTKNIKELKKVDKKILSKSLQVFDNVIREFKPSVIILHGALTVETFRKLMDGNNVRYFSDNDKMDEIEKLNPYAEIELNGKTASILASKHFMYYGKTGNSFQNLKKNLKEMLDREDKFIER